MGARGQGKGEREIDCYSVSIFYEEIRLNIAAFKRYVALNDSQLYFCKRRLPRRCAPRNDKL